MTSGAENVTPRAIPRGMIEIFRTGSAPWAEHPDERVPAFVVGGAAAILGAHQHLPLGAEHDPLECVGEIGAEHLVVAAPGGEQRSLVHEVREIGADHPGGRRGDAAEIDVGTDRHQARVHLEDRLAAAAIGGRRTATRRSKRPGRSNRLVHYVGPVRCRDHDHAGRRVEPAHLRDQDLVERLLALVVPAGRGRPRGAARGRLRRARR